MNKIKNADLLLQIGESMYEKTKYFIYFGPVGIVGLVITILCTGEYAVKYLAFNGYYAFVNGLMGLWYLMIAIGTCVVFPYFMGLILLGLGQIAKNTDPANNQSAAPVSDELPDL